MAGAFQFTAFQESGFQMDGLPPPVGEEDLWDDGERKRRKREAEERESREGLRKALVAIIDPKEDEPQVVVDVPKREVRSVSTGRYTFIPVQIDIASIERAVTRAIASAQEEAKKVLARRQAEEARRAEERRIRRKRRAEEILLLL